MTRLSFQNKLLENLIKEIVKSVLTEADPASKSGPSPDFDAATNPGRRISGAPQAPQKQTTFNFEQLDSIQNPQEKYNYVSATLKWLGQGSGRVVFKLDNVHALKLINPENADAGKAQNEAEMQVCKASKGLFNTVHKAAKDFSWIVSDLAQKMDPNTFQKLTKIDWDVFRSALHVPFQGVTGGTSNMKDQYKQDFELVKNMPFFQLAVNVAKSCSLVPGDLTNIDNWGHIGNTPKLIDYGFKMQHVGKINTNDPNIKV